MNILAKEIQTYLETLLPSRPAVQVEMEEEAARNGFPIIGPVVGVVLELMARAVGAKRIFELGSGFGYSGLWFARALPEDGELFLTDNRPDNLERARRAFETTGHSSVLRTLQGSALDLFKMQDGPFDIVLNDIDKQEYPKVPDLAWRRLIKGGLLITDNTLWSGRVVEANPDAATRGILEYNRLVSDREKWLTSLIPLRDGVSVSMKVA